MEHKLPLLIQIVQPNNFVQLPLATDCARIALFIHPLYRERLHLIKFTNLLDLAVELVQLDIALVLEVNDRDQARVEYLDLHVLQLQAVGLIQKVHASRIGHAVFKRLRINVVHGRTELITIFSICIIGQGWICAW